MCYKSQYPLMQQISYRQQNIAVLLCDDAQHYAVQFPAPVCSNGQGSISGVHIGLYDCPLVS